MRNKPNTLTHAHAALLRSARRFASTWGEPAQEDDGSIRFPSAPQPLDGLRVEAGLVRKWMGGVCSMNFRLRLSADSVENCVLRFRGGRFGGKPASGFGRSLLAALNADAALLERLKGIDIESLTVRTGAGSVEIALTPYGGGLVYLVVPPVHYAVALPSEQVGPMAQGLEHIARIVKQTKANN